MAKKTTPLTRRAMTGVIAGGLTATLVGCAAGATTGGSSGGPDWAAEMSPVTLTFSSIGVPQEASTQGLVAMGEALEEVSGGSITAEVFDSNSLLPQNEQLSSTGSGVADVVQLVGAVNPQELPITNWLAPMGAAFTEQWPTGNLVGSAATAELFLTEPELVAEYEQHNLVPLASQMLFQQYDILCKDPVESVADARGLLVRTPGPVWSAELEALGMVPVNLAGAETYEGLQRGTVDCTVGTPTIFQTLGLLDIAKYYLPVKMTGFNGYTTVINKDTWDAMPVEAQQAVEDAALTSWETVHEGYFELYGSFAEELEEYGIVSMDPTEFNEVLSAHQESAVADLAASAPAGVSDPQGMVDRYTELAAKWQATFDELGYDLPELADGPAEAYEAGAAEDFADFYDRVHADVLEPNRLSGQ